MTMLTKKDLRESRIFVMMLLYNCDILKQNLDEAIKCVFNEENFNQRSIDLTKSILDRLEEIDIIIENNLENYSLNRLNLVDKAIIRLATYEMLSDVPASIVINEALEITKEYSDTGDKKAVSFNNKLLEKIKVDIHGK